jgi:hypothetical protein
MAPLSYLLVSKQNLLYSIKQSYKHKHVSHWGRILEHVYVCSLFICLFLLAISTFFKLMCWVRHCPPVPIVSWWGPLQWVNPLQPSVRSSGQSFFSLLLCCCFSSGCNMRFLWFPSLSWWFILFPWMPCLMNGTFRSSCKVWLVTYQGAFVIIRSILDWLRCILAIWDLLANTTKIPRDL